MPAKARLVTAWAGFGVPMCRGGWRDGLSSAHAVVDVRKTARMGKYSMLFPFVLILDGCKWRDSFPWHGANGW
jgi:hypothetical protein